MPRKLPRRRQSIATDAPSGADDQSPQGNGKNPSSPVTGYRMHTHFEILRGIPERIDATPATPQGKDDERAVLADAIQPDHCDVIDRGYAKFELFNQIHALGSSYVSFSE